MPGSGIWLDDETYLKTAGQMWAQQQTQTLQAGHDWAQQQIQQTLSQLQQMVPQVPSTPPPAPAPTPVPVVPPAEAPAPTPMPAPTPQVPIGGTTQVAPPIPTPAPTVTPQPAPVVVPPSTTSTTPAAGGAADAGETWAQQQIQNLLNPSVPQPSSTSPAAPVPGLDTTPAPTPPTAAAGPQPTTPGDFVDQARQAAATAGIDPEVFSRQIQQESNFNPNAQSGAGARGIAQFMPQTAQGLGIDPDDPSQALPAAAKLMKSYLDKYGGDWASALSAYNAGPGNTPVGGGVAPFEETKRYVSNILGDAAQAGQTAVNTAVQGVQAATARVSQFGMGLASGDAMAFCGPAAALAFAQSFGRNPTVQEAKQLAQQVGWNPDQGMAGPSSEVSLLKSLGVDAHMTSGVDWAQVGRDAAGGNPVIIDTPGHYYYVDGYNGQTGQLHVGTSGTDLKGGSEWMTPDQINGMAQSHGPARAAIFADHPLAQQDGLAQSVGRQNLTMGTMQPAGDQTDIGSQIGQSVGSVLPNVPLPFLGGQSAADIGALLGRNQEQLQQGRDLVSTMLAPSDQAQIGKKADSIVQAVQDVGSKATQAGQDLLQQTQQTLQQAPQTVSDILQQNAMTAQGIPNIGGKALDQFRNNLMGTNPDQDLINQNYAAAQRATEQATGASVALPSNPLDMLGGASLGAPTSGEGLTAQRNEAIAQGNPLRDIPLLGGASTFAAQAALDPTNLFLGAGPGLGRAALPAVGELASNQALRGFLAGESGELNLGAFGRAPLTGEGMLSNALDRLSGYPEEIAGPIREWAAQVDAPASRVASTVQRWMAENPLEAVVPQVEAGPTIARATVARAVSDLEAAISRPRGPGLPGGVMPGQLPLLSEHPYQPLMPEGAGPPGVPSAPSTQEWLRRLDAAQTQQHFDQLQQTLDRAGLLGDRPSTQTIGGQTVMPGIQPGAPVTMAERARLYHVGNVISSTATLAKVAINSMFNPAWSFASRGAADIAGATPLGRLAGIAPEEALGRAQGSLIGAQGSMATWGEQFMNGFREPYTRASSLAARETNPVAQAWATAWETPGALHNAFQTAGQSVLENMELGRLAGQDAAAQGLKGSAFRDEVARLIADPRPGWIASAQGIAQRAVLRGDLGTMGQMFGNLAGQGAIGGTGGTARQAFGNVLFPVFRIGMNALTQGVEKSPLGLVGTGVDVARGLLGTGPYRAAAEGLGPSFERPLSSAVAPLSERLTNNLVGTAVTAALAKYAADGSITGNGPTDPQQRAVLLAQGWQPNSIRTPMGYVSYQGTPIEVAAGLVGEFADALHNPQSKRELEQPYANVVAERLFAGTLNMLTSRTGMETLAQLSDMIHTAAQDPEQAKAQFGTGLAANILSGYVPAAGPLRDIARATDPLMRQPPPGDIGAALGQNIPLLREQVQPRLDVLGRAAANPQQGLGAILPARLGPGEDSPIAVAMGRTGVAPVATPLTIPYGPYGEIRLTPQERMAYEQYRGQVTQQAATNLAASPQFQQMPLNAQRAALEQINSLAADAASKMVLRDIGPSGMARMTPTGVLAPVQGYQPGGLGDQYLTQATLLRSQAQHQALMQSLLGGRSGLQALQEANAAAAGAV